MSQIHNLKSSLFEPTLNFRPELKNKVPIIRLDEVKPDENNVELQLELEGEEEKKSSENKNSEDKNLDRQSSLSKLLKDF
jgi:hypothetical protein